MREYRADEGSVNIRNFLWVGLVVDESRLKKIANSSIMKIEIEFRNQKEYILLFLTDYAQAVTFLIREPSV